MKIRKVLVYLILLTIIAVPNKVFASKEEVVFSKCVDGDTAKFIINGKEYSTRFLAIDTPETKHPKKKQEPYGKEASNYTCKRLKEAKKITFEYDDESTKEDKYGRKLAWIFVDNSLLQEELVEKGYAKVAYLYGNYKYTNRLQIKEKNAKNKKIGIWNPDNNVTKNQSISLEQIIDKIFQYIRKELKNML